MHRYNIVSFNMSRYADWQTSGVVNRNFHIIQNLAKDERVSHLLSVDFLPFTWKKAAKSFIFDQVTKDRRGEIIYGDLTTQVWHVKSKIYVFSTIDSMLRPHRVISEIKIVLERLGMSENLLVWNFNPLYTDYFGAFGQKLNIFDAVDNWSEHSSYKYHRKKLLNNYEAIKKNSDIIYTVSEDLAGFLDTPKTHWLPNAVDFEHFQQIDRMPSLEMLKKPIIGFLGVLQDRIDVSLVAHIATEHPDKTIILAGPVWKTFPKEKFAPFQNVIFTGPVHYRDIPKFYNSFDVGIIPYAQNAFIKSTNSMKYYEYLAAGLPVITTRSGGVERFEDIMYISSDHQEFSDLITKALDEDSAQKQQKRRDYVHDMTWQSRIDKIFSDIEGVIQS